METFDVNNIILIMLIIGTLFFLKLCNQDIIENYSNNLNLESHKICPVMNRDTKITACIHYPQLNLGFICSVCCSECISNIQKYFKNEKGSFL